MADPFPVDPPDAASEASAVPHDDVQAALSDALGVSVEPVKAAAPLPQHDMDGSIPSGQSMSDMLTARNAEIAQAKKLAAAAALEATDPSPSTDTIRAAVGLPPRFDNQTLPRDPSVTPRKGDAFPSPESAAEAWSSERAKAHAEWTITGENPAPERKADTFSPPGWAPAPEVPPSVGFQVTERHEPGDMPKSWMASLEQQAGENPNGGTPMPGPGPFRDRAELSQKIKRAIKAESAVLPDVEVEGLHIIAQLVAKIMTIGPNDARLVWLDLAKHCDDVAAALR